MRNKIGRINLEYGFERATRRESGMKLLYLFDKLLRTLTSEGLRETLRELIFLNRTLVIIEKEIGPAPRLLGEDMQVVMANGENFRECQEQYGINLYLCQRGATGLLLCKQGHLVGFQFWTRDCRLNFLEQFGISLNKDEAYLFDFFVFPAFRGTLAAKILSAETHNLLISEGVRKFYGAYYLDNLKALWWHRAFLKCREIKRVTFSQFLIIEINNGKLKINL